MQGIGWALNEEYIYNAKGRLENPGFLDYRMPVASDLPMIETILVEVPNPTHPYGVRGVGEVPIVPPTAAVGNAIVARHRHPHDRPADVAAEACEAIDDAAPRMAAEPLLGAIEGPRRAQAARAGDDHLAGINIATKSAPMMSSAQLSEATIQASPSLPRTSGRTPSGSRTATRPLSADSAASE